MHKKFSDEDIATIVKLYTKDKMTQDQIAEKFGIRQSTISAILIRNGIRSGIDCGKKVSKETQKQIIDGYINDNKSSRELGREYNLQHSSILNILKRNDVKRRTDRKFDINEDFFISIDSHEKAYILGLLYADGHNDLSKNTVDLRLHYQDKHILETINHFIQNANPLKYRKGKKINCIIGNKQRCINQSPSYVLCMYSKKLATQLNELGCVPRKSLILKFPTEDMVPAEFINSFILGYFDGDGCIYISKRSARFSLISTNDFCVELQRILSNFGIKSSISDKYSSSRNMSNNITKVLYSDDMKSLRLLYLWLYKDSSIYFYRKKNKFDIVYEDIERRLKNRSDRIRLQKQIVSEYKSKTYTVSELSIKYGISANSIYKYIRKFRSSDSC